MKRLFCFLVFLFLVNISVSANAQSATFAGGDGSEANPFQIANWQHLNEVRNNLTSHFILMNNLDSTTVGYAGLADSAAHGGSGWLPIGTDANQFTGNFSGQGFEIRDLVINRPAENENNVGLFGAVGTGGVITNIGVVNAAVIGQTRVGGLVGANQGTVTNSYFTGIVVGRTAVGGLVGVNQGTVTNSYSTGDVFGVETVGGLVGANTGTVTNSYSTGIVVGRTAVGGLVGWNNEGTVTNSFWDTQASRQATSSGGTGVITTEMTNILTFSGATWDIAAVANDGVRNTAHTWNIVDGETYPFLSSQRIPQHALTILSTDGGSVTTPGEGTFTYDGGTEVNLVATPDAGLHFARWTGDVGTIANVNNANTTIRMDGNYTIVANFVSSFAGGDGTADNPFQIANWWHLLNVRNYLNSHFVLMNNLDSTTAGYAELASSAAHGRAGWQPIGTDANQFTGNFNGQEFEIRDLFINRFASNVGLFGAVGAGGVIENIGVVNVLVVGRTRVGSLVGNNQGTVSNSYSTGTVIGIVDAGGLVGINSGTVTNSYSTGTVTGTVDAGGLVGINSGTVTNSYSTGTVTGLAGDVGGLVGINSGTVTNSFWDTETSGQATSAGGTGVTTAEMTNILTFSGADWDIAAVANDGVRNTAHTWNIVDGVTYPLLSWQPIVRYSLTMTVTPDGGGTAADLTAEPPYPAGVTVNIQAVANPGVVFVNWTAPAGTFGDATAATTTFTMPMPGQDVIVTANFAIFAAGNGTAADPFQITNWTHLHSVRKLSTSHFILMNDLDSTTAGYAELASYTAHGGTGWQPIGTWDIQFAGNFNGQGFEIRDLVINRPAENYVGLFGSVGAGGVIEYVGVINVNVTGHNYVGGLVGDNQGTVINSYATGSVTGESNVGGLLGINWWGTVTNSFWDTETSGQATSAGGTGVTTAEMTNILTFSGADWDIAAVANDGVRNTAHTWNIVDGVTYPFLNFTARSEVVQVQRIPDFLVKLGPNPIKENLIVTISDAGDYVGRVVRLSVYDSRGRAFTRREIVINGVFDEVEVDVSQLPAGVCFVVLEIEGFDAKRVTFAKVSDG